MIGIDFRVYGLPKGQPRPRAFSRNGSARVYDPGTAEGWKSQIAEAARPYLPTTPLEGPLTVRLDLWFPRPKAHFKGKTLRADAPTWCEKKPDADNLAKAVLDAMTTLGFWGDDAQVVCLWAMKRYVTTVHNAPGVNVMVARPVGAA